MVFKMTGKSRRPQFRAGRDQHIAYAEQGHAILHTEVSNAAVPEEIDIVAEIRALREAIAKFAALDSPAVTLLNAAEKEAATTEPRRDQVVNFVEGATKLAAGVNAFAQQSDQFVPRLQQIAKWAGYAWNAWAPSLGM